MHCLVILADPPAFRALGDHLLRALADRRPVTVQDLSRPFPIEPATFRTIYLVAFLLDVKPSNDLLAAATLLMRAHARPGWPW